MRGGRAAAPVGDRGGAEATVADPSHLEGSGLDFGGGALVWEGELAARVLGEEPDSRSWQRRRARPVVDGLLREGRLVAVLVSTPRAAA